MRRELPNGFVKSSVDQFVDRNRMGSASSSDNPDSRNSIGGIPNREWIGSALESSPIYLLCSEVTLFAA